VGFRSSDELVAELKCFQKWYAVAHLPQRPALDVLLGSGASSRSGDSHAGVCDTDDARRVIRTACAPHVCRGLFNNCVMFGDSSGKVRCIYLLFCTCVCSGAPLHVLYSTVPE
jgi:hypothetical protein